MHKKLDQESIIFTPVLPLKVEKKRPKILAVLDVLDTFFKHQTRSDKTIKRADTLSQAFLIVEQGQNTSAAVSLSSVCLAELVSTISLHAANT